MIERVGKVVTLSSRGTAWHLRIGCTGWNEPLTLGESLAVNGVCLTVTSSDERGFEADVLEETIRRTALAKKRTGSPVNLERAMRCDGRFGGHMVTGHVDGVGVLTHIKSIGPDWALTVECEPALLRQMVEKGSVACDGVSLTLTAVRDDSFDVHLVPFTRAHTSLDSMREGDRLNIETAPLAKHVQRQIEAYLGRGTVTEALLRRSGFAD